jgi:hypothetical protein
MVARRPKLSRRSAFALRASVDSLRSYESEGWAHFEFTRINTTPTIRRKKIEDVREAGASAYVQLVIARLGSRTCRLRLRRTALPLTLPGR